MSESGAFDLLDERIQRFIWSEGWSELRDAQERAIPEILLGEKDVIIAASTATGKTEAAFFPALTYMLKEKPTGLILYVSPLKALINDQFGRLERLCETLDLPVWPWHGDISSSSKTRFYKERRGVLLITPESLEAFLCLRGTSIASVFGESVFVIIDELHAFIGTERGKQLESILHRIEKMLNRRVPRIGLSATLGDMRLAAGFLRPGEAERVSLINSGSSGSELKVRVKGHEEPNPTNLGEEEKEAESLSAVQISRHLYQALRGSNNLVFPNSRREVERYAYLLGKLCKENQVPNEFWPHHGSLSKEIRAETEAALKQKNVPATAVCTNTLELGIDIGAIRSVAQIGPPATVASLRQRLGRSGRRKGEPAILWGHCIEGVLDQRAPLAVQLRLETLQIAAMISLLIEGWFEPPKSGGLHASTLIQQLLSIIAQYGGVTAGKAHSLLCSPESPFSKIEKEDFLDLLHHLGQKNLLMQDSSGLLLHGSVGEKFVNHYSFYAAFASEEEFRVVTNGKTLGSIPVSQMLVPGQRILFAGKTWLVDEVNEQEKIIHVTRARGGVPPGFSGGGGRVHNRVKQKMHELLASHHTIPFLDETATRFLGEARQAYNRLNLSTRILVDEGQQVTILTWLGDGANETIAFLLLCRGFTAQPSDLGVEVQKGNHSLSDIETALTEIARSEPPSLETLFDRAKNLEREKWDWALPEVLLRKNYASLYLDFEGAYSWLRIDRLK